MNHYTVNRVFLFGIVQNGARKPHEFTLATHEKFGKDQQTDHTEYHLIRLSESLCGMQVNEGDHLQVTGKIRTQVVTDEKQIRRYQTYVVAQEVVRL